VYGFEAEKQRQPTSKGCHFLMMEYNHGPEVVTVDVLQKIA
jgi:hypothetical protein